MENTLNAEKCFEIERILVNRTTWENCRSFLSILDRYDLAKKSHATVPLWSDDCMATVRVDTPPLPEPLIPLFTASPPP